jgi:hypothetical protein
MKNINLIRSMKNHLLVNGKLFVSSFTKPGRNFFYAMLADMIQAVLIVVLIIVLLLMLRGSIVPIVTEVMPTVISVNSYVEQTSSLPPLTEEMKSQLDSNVNAVKSFFINSILSIVLFIFLVLLVSSLIRGYIYSRLHKSAYLKFVWRFSLHNILWYLFFGALVILSFFTFKLIVAGYVVVSLLIFMIIFTPIFRSLHHENDTMKKFYSRFFRKGILRFYRLIITFIAIYIIVMLAILLLSFILKFASLRLMAFILFISIFAAIAWTRHYIFISVEEHLK